MDRSWITLDDYTSEEYVNGVKSFMKVAMDNMREGMVRNRARPEGSIAEAYLMKESLSFCSLYLHGYESKRNREQRNYDGQEIPDATLSVFKSKIRTFGEDCYVQMTSEEYNSFQWFVLNNCMEIEPYMREHAEKLKHDNPSRWEARQKKEFPSWFKSRVMELHNMSSPEATDELLALALGPDQCMSRCNGCVVEGVKFFTIRRDSRRVTQNSGVCAESIHKGKMIKFYGVPEDIIELSYVDNFSCVLFRCKWFDLDRHRPIKINSEFTSINTRKLWYRSDPYVLENQATQVFYVSDTKLKGSWKVVQSSHHRHLFDPSVTYIEELLDMNDAHQQDNCVCIQIEDNDLGTTPVVHTYNTPKEVDVPIHFIPHANNENDEVEDFEDHDDTLSEYFSSDDEAMSQSYADSDLE